MNNDLERVFGDLANQVPEDDDELEFSADVLPRSDSNVASDQILIGNSEHQYHGYTQNRIDALWVQASKRTLRLLDILFLSKVFHVEPRTILLKLSHPKSEVKSIVLDLNDEIVRAEPIRHFETNPSRYTYWPNEISRFPLSEDRFDRNWLPLFALTNTEDSVGPWDEDWKSRNVLKCPGSVYGALLFAQVLLDASRRDSEVDELRFESDIGFGGAGTGSAELVIFLPGSNGWDGELGEK